MEDNQDILETHRARLEESIRKLRKALKTWQEQSAEYEGLREELLAMPVDSNKNDMLAIANDFGGTIITHKEISSLLGNDRKPAQVADVVGRRIDYVQDNITQVQKQLEKAEERLTAVDVLIKPDQITNEEGLPLMEIREELDEDGNVIESSINPEASSRAVPLNLDALKVFKPFIGKPENGDSKLMQQLKPTPNGSVSIVRQNETANSPSEKQDVIGNSEPGKAGESSSLPSAASKNHEISSINSSLIREKGDESPISRKDVPMEGVAQIKVRSNSDSDNSEDEFSNLPEVEEDEESAQMRRDMIRYNLNEIGAIVAEMDLDENPDYDYHDDDLEDVDVLSDDLGADGIVENNEDDDDDESEEDEFGRSLSRGVTAKMRREMQVLQDRMQAREDARKRTQMEGVNEQEKLKKKELDDKEQVMTPGAKSSVKKGVRFAEELDIAPLEAKTTFEAVEDIDDTTIDPNILDMVFGPGTKDAEARLFQDNVVETPKAKKPSLFKTAKILEKTAGQTFSPITTIQNPERGPISKDGTSRAEESNIPRPNLEKKNKSASIPSQVPKSTAELQTAAIMSAMPDDIEDSDSEPQKQILSNTIIERPLVKPKTARPPDELDSNIVQQEISMSYHKMKNQLVQRQGGYGETDEEKQFVPLNENGEKKKISRFKAKML